MAISSMCSSSRPFHLKSTWVRFCDGQLGPRQEGLVGGLDGLFDLGGGAACGAWAITSPVLESVTSMYFSVGRFAPLAVDAVS